MFSSRRRSSRSRCWISQSAWSASSAAAQTGVRHGPRAIDIDILLLGDLELHDERMSLPHEQLLKRRFVLIPALELDFELRAPGGERLADALAALALDEGVRWAGPPLRLPAS